MHKGSSRGHRKYADPLPGCPLTDPGVVYYFSIDEVNSLRFLEDMSLRTWVYLAKLITFQPSHMARHVSKLMVTTRDPNTSNGHILVPAQKRKVILTSRSVKMCRF